MDYHFFFTDGWHFCLLLILLIILGSVAKWVFSLIVAVLVLVMAFIVKIFQAIFS